jgi:3-oxosteroid 1-dehydrogenase
MNSFDMVVVGAGPAGITAALSGAHFGKRVALIEKAERLGGTGLGSAYGIWVPKNRHLQALGIEDDKTDCLKLMCKNSYPEIFDEQAENYGVPAEDFALFEAYYDSASEMLDLFEAETGIDSKPMLNHSRDFDTYKRTQELLEERDIFKSEEMLRYLPDYHAEDPFNRAPVGRYLTFGLTPAAATLYYSRILGKLGAKTLARCTLQMFDPSVLLPILRGAGGKYKEGVFGYAGSGVRITSMAGKLLAQKGVEVHTQTKLEEIQFDTSGNVCGIEVQNAKSRQKWTTDSIILTTGGFNYDAKLVEQYAAKTPVVSSNGIPTNTGDAIYALKDQNAKLTHMDQYWLSESIYQEVAENNNYDAYASHNLWYLNGDSFVVVDQHGNRCYDESKPYSIRAKYYQQPDRLLTFLVFDHRCYTKAGGLFRYWGPGIPYKSRLQTMKPRYLLEGKDAGDLAMQIDKVLARYRHVLDVNLTDDWAQNLEASMTRYNGFAKKGVDDDFGRGSQLGYTAWLNPRTKGNSYPNKTMHPMDASQGLYAVVLCASCFSTKGGLATDGEARVLRNNDTAINGLYAAGNCSASPSNTGYVLSTIGPAMTFGYIAARHAAGQQSTGNEKDGEAKE